MARPLLVNHGQCKCLKIEHSLIFTDIHGLTLDTINSFCRFLFVARGRKWSFFKISDTQNFTLWWILIWTVEHFWFDDSWGNLEANERHYDWGRWSKATKDSLFTSKAFNIFENMSNLSPVVQNLKKIQTGLEWLFHTEPSAYGYQYLILQLTS